MFPRVVVPLVIVAFFLACETHGQDVPPLPAAKQRPDLFEVGLGFDYLRVPDAIAKNMYGFDLSLFVNVNSWLSLGGEFTGGFGTEKEKVFFREVTVHENRIAYLFGPRVNVWRKKDWKFFLEALGGGGHGHIEATVFGVRRTASADAFAAAIGGGAEWQFFPHWSWRVVEADYQPVHFSGTWEDEWRFSSAICYSFGAGW